MKALLLLLALTILVSCSSYDEQVNSLKSPVILLGKTKSNVSY